MPTIIDGSLGAKLLQTKNQIVLNADTTLTEAHADAVIVIATAGIKVTLPTVAVKNGVTFKLHCAVTSFDITVTPSLTDLTSNSTYRVYSGEVVHLTSDGNMYYRASLTSRFGSIGVGQTWQDVTASRNAGVTYTNSTGKPIQVIVRMGTTVINNGNAVQFYVDNNLMFSASLYSYSDNMGIIIPNGSTYKATTSNGTVEYWRELR